MRAGTIAGALSATILLLYWWLEQSFPTPLRTVDWRMMTTIIVIIAISVILAKLIGPRTSRIVTNIHVSIASVLLSLAVIEGVFRLFPQIFPDNLRMYV